MRKNIEMSSTKIKGLVQDFYKYFETGYAFEEFLKKYLEIIGLQEVVVTQRSSDGGIDLQALRYGVGTFNGGDSIEYFVQAKRYKPGTTIPIEKVRALRGVMPSGSKGIFITTANYSQKTEEFVEQDPSRPIILIDGKKLIESCIDYEIGFVFTPVFSKTAMDSLKDNSKKVLPDKKKSQDNPVILTVERQISSNDIRARILRFPKVIANTIPESEKKLKVIFNDLPSEELTISKERTYLAAVTKIYKASGLISDDGSYNPCKAKWDLFSDGTITITIL